MWFEFEYSFVRFQCKADGSTNISDPEKWWNSIWRMANPVVHAPGKWFKQAKAVGKIDNEKATMLFDSGAEV